MIGSLFTAIGPASFRLAQSPAAFGGDVHPVAPGSHSNYTGVTLPATSVAFAATLVAGFPIGRAGRSGSAAAWPGARSNPSCGKGAGK